MSDELFRLLSQSQATLRFPCIPAAYPQIWERLREALQAWSKFHRYSMAEEFEGVVQEMLKTRLNLGFERSANFQLQVTFAVDPPGANLQLQVQVLERDPHQGLSGADAFGTLPDARVLELAGEHPFCRVCDLGAGGGRNALALARKGHPTLAIDSTSHSIARLILQARRERLRNLKTERADLREPNWPVADSSQDLCLAVGLFPHMRGLHHVKHVLNECARLTRPGGRMLANLFLSEPGFEPDPLTRQMAQAVWSYFNSRAELQECLGSLWTLSEELPTLEYEKERTAPESWPPTPWFEAWSQGHNLFPEPQTSFIKLCWVVLQRS